jgi:hypothetical protein
MKYRIVATLVASLLFSMPGWAVTDAVSGFASLKNLAGQWESKDEKGAPAITSWKLVSGGSALMEEMPHESMVTMYHLDNDRLLMTHYCSAKNQPRMQAEISPDGKTITFNFVDATNVARPTDGHMQKMVLTMQDQDHFSEKWTFGGGEGKEHTMTIQYTRKQ